jgi:DNA-binding NtrC family response regulator
VSDGEARSTILVVDDQDAVRRIAQRLLTRLGYRVVEAENAAAALEILASEEIVLLISDVVMPGDIDGVALACIAAERWPGLKVILTSGYPEGYSGSNEAAVGDFRLLSKPYRAKELTEAVQQSLGAL